MHGEAMSWEAVGWFTLITVVIWTVVAYVTNPKRRGCPQCGLEGTGGAFCNRCRQAQGDPFEQNVP